MSDGAPLALVTGATGYVGSRLVPRLLQEGTRVRVLTRDRARVAARSWFPDVDVLEGDAAFRSVLQDACAGVGVAYYLLHSMDGGSDFSQRDRDLALSFGIAAQTAGVQRIVYLSGLHPSGPLSTHLASRVEVGDLLLASGVPTAVLQAAMVVGSGSASFEMLRHLTQRLPAMVAPTWLDSRIQPIAIRDVLHYLVACADLPAEHSRTFDVGGPDVLTYREMIAAFARVAGLRPRPIITVPAVLPPSVASRWVRFVTPVPSGLARPLVGSLLHDVVCAEQDLAALVGAPPGGSLPFERAVAVALQEDPSGERPEPGTVPPERLTAADPQWAGA
jgi:uncharacterized protein YbjT (DUF2867 family)